MSSKEGITGKRVSPDVAQVYLLDEIAGRLLALERQLPVKPQGIVEPLNPTNVTTTPRTLHPPFKRKWFSMSISNDGPDDCWVHVNTEKSPNPFLTRVGEVYEVDMQSPVIEDIRVWTDAGTAALRIKGVR